MQFGADDRRVRGGGGVDAPERPHHHDRLAGCALVGREGEAGERLVAFEGRSAMPPRLGERDPELQRIEGDGALAHRVLGVRDPGAARHEVERTARDDHVAADRVAVAHVARERPGDGLEADVRMRLHPHRRDLRAEAVEEAPRAHERQIALRQRPVHLHRADAAERHLARFEQERPRTVALRRRLDGDARLGVESGHASVLTRGRRARATPR